MAFEKENLQSIGKRIKYAREKRKMTQEDLSRILHISNTTICKFEGNNTIPSLEQLADISKALGVRIEYLIGIDSLFDETTDFIVNFVQRFSISTTKECTIKSSGKDAKEVNENFSFCLTEDYLLLKGEKRLFSLIRDIAQAEVQKDKLSPKIYKQMVFTAKKVFEKSHDKQQETYFLLSGSQKDEMIKDLVTKESYAKCLLEELGMTHPLDGQFLPGTEEDD